MIAEKPSRISPSGESGPSGTCVIARTGMIVLATVSVLAGFGMMVYYLITPSPWGPMGKADEVERLNQFLAGKSQGGPVNATCAELITKHDKDNTTPLPKTCCEQNLHYSAGAKHHTLGKGFYRYDDALMNLKEYGTCTKQPVQPEMRWGGDVTTAGEVCCWNRHGAERKYSWEKVTAFWAEVDKLKTIPGSTITFYDTITQKPLYVAPVGRPWDDFIQESKDHGWPSFRDTEIVQENVRILPQNKEELISIDGTHLGHNLPDYKGNRHCVNLVSVLGKKKEC